MRRPSMTSATRLSTIWEGLEEEDTNGSRHDRAHRQRRTPARGVRVTTRTSDRGGRHRPGDLRAQLAHPLGRRSVRGARLPRHRAGAVRPRRARHRARLHIGRCRAWPRDPHRDRVGRDDARRRRRGRPRGTHRAGRGDRLLLGWVARLVGGERAPRRRRGRLLRRPDHAVPRPHTEVPRACSTSGRSTRRSRSTASPRSPSSTPTSRSTSTKKPTTGSTATPGRRITRRRRRWRSSARSRSSPR